MVMSAGANQNKAISKDLAILLSSVVLVFLLLDIWLVVYHQDLLHRYWPLDFMLPAVTLLCIGWACIKIRQN